MKFEVYVYDKVLQENDSATVKEIYVNDRREKLEEIFKGTPYEITEEE